VCMTHMCVCCYRSESVAIEKLLKEKEQIISELMDEGDTFWPLLDVYKEHFPAK